jgi:S1-C subfamily serine protease
MKKLLALLVLTLVVPAGTVLAENDVRNSIVKIYCVSSSPDYDNPWNMFGPQYGSGSGCIISGNRILTNAHVVSDQTYLQVRLHGHSKKYKARLLAVSHEADLALLTVDDRAFFRDADALKIGELPHVQQEVTVYGFPRGGDTLSTTTGVVSRIEHQYYTHSLIQLLAAQIDAAVNSGNSGGPAMAGGRVVGVVMQSLQDSDNIGYIVPPPVINHFLKDMQDGRYDGIPHIAVGFQSMENPNLKKMYGLGDDRSGVLVTDILPGSPAQGRFRSGDIVTEIAGRPIADDGTVEFRPNERTHFSFYVQQHQIGEEIGFAVLRSGRHVPLTMRLTRSWGDNRLVPMMRYDVRPTYYVYGGMVFCPLTLNYLQTWTNWKQNTPVNLLHYWRNGRPTTEGEEVVVLIKVLTADLNDGYDDFIDQRIVRVNGREFANLQEMIRLIENASDAPFVVFENEKGSRISLERNRVEAEQGEILQTYDIASDRSEDLRTAAVEAPETADELAELKSPASRP